MKVQPTCLKCGYKIEADLEVEVDTNRFTGRSSQVSTKTGTGTPPSRSQ